ncbi:hypothetical protein EVAR_23464_1 [Eumeta japonica]|uniref:Uncharacterized protein n=1 Tax=Eumeta variegata TaxID=151549 RepID=A0A4C1UJQ9_EUMVA|nr:hypothetical protein EVAR_23464_1 [Eumeta japonica]
MLPPSAGSDNGLSARVERAMCALSVRTCACCLLPPLALRPSGIRFPATGGHAHQTQRANNTNTNTRLAPRTSAARLPAKMLPGPGTPHPVMGPIRNSNCAPIDGRLTI